MDGPAEEDVHHVLEESEEDQMDIEEDPSENLVDN